MTTFIYADDVVYSEGASSAVFTVRLSAAAPAGGVVVQYATAGGSATAGTDYTAASGSITIAQGATTGTITIALGTDALAEKIEGFLLSLSSPTADVETINSTVTAVIVDNDAATGTPGVSIGNTVVDETAGTATLVISLDQPSSGTVSVNWSTYAGTATAGQDYTTTTGSVSFAAGEMVKTITVPILNDTTAEGKEAFSVELTSVSGATITDGRAQVVIQENDATPVATPAITLHGETVSEAQGYVDYFVTLTAPSASDISVDYATSNGTATAGTDYVATSGTLYFAAGETSKVVRVLLLDDAVPESYEYLWMNLSNPVNATLLDTAGGHGINDDDTPLASDAVRSDRTGNTTTGDVLFGTSGSDTFYGNTGNDFIDAGAGTDYMFGGAGNDTFVAEDSFGGIYEYSGNGTDTVISYLDTGSTALADYVENLVLGGSANLSALGNGLDNVMTGNVGNNTLTGDAGNDTLNGGDGTDTLVGGLGDDTYIVDTTTDTITENSGEGTDTVQSSVTYTLGSNLENLTLTGSGVINGTGNSLNNVLTGNSAANVLTGGAGNDTYVIDSLSDTLVENSGGGTDTVQSSVTYTLGSNFENLTLTGNAAINGTGNALDNVLTGNSAANTLTGGAGNDTYVTDSVSDTIVENSGEGTDTIQASVTYSLASVANVENLTLTGTAAINATGSSGNNVITGNSGANTLDGGSGVDTLAGGLGDDIYVVDTTTDTITENSNEGTDTVQSSVTYTLGSNLENLTLTGSGVINGTGNSLNNVLTGNSAANTLTGGAGNDTYVIDSLSDTIVENSGEGTDTIQSSITYTLTVANVENVTLSGSGNINATGTSTDNVLTGNAGNNTLTALAGNDTLDGGAGVDTLVGGLGDDIYVVDSTTDTITESSGEGTDTIQSSVTYTLTAANVENLTLTGTAAINATGSSGNNVITGNSGANTLDGGAGTDTLVGGAGNDTYVVDSLTDTITENSGEGTDTIQSSITYTLSVANVENVTLSGSGNINATGDTNDNVLTGNIGNNTLTGGGGNDTLDGGAGVDTLIGGTGDDTYVVDSLTDTITENSGEGTDTVQSSVDYMLLGGNLENLTLTGSSNISGVGNAVDNVITGNSGNNYLNGLVGADTMIGGAGNDFYMVDNVGDVVTENAGEGTDVVRSYISYTLGSNLENLKFKGAAAIDGTGNAGNNVMSGNGAANTLDGQLGNDTLIGLAGNDVFQFSTALNASTNVDVIYDFAAGDTIALDNDIFTALGSAGALSGTQFFSGAGLTASTGVGQGAGIYYDTTSGNLYYDADGFGGAASTEFATLYNHAALTAASFSVVD